MAFTDGRIVTPGGKPVRLKKKVADFLLRYTRDITLAVVEAKSDRRPAGDGLQQARAYADILGLKFAYATGQGTPHRGHHARDQGAARGEAAMTWPTVKLGGVLTHRKEFVQIDDLASYKRCRVQLHAQGVVIRDEVLGTAIKTKKQQVCKAGEFLVAEIDAKHGGYGLVPDDLDGAIVSSHYFLFGMNEAKIDRRYLGWYIRTPAFFEQVAAQGSTNYAAIRPAHVLGYEVPLPPLAEQRRLVARIDAVAAKIDEARRLREEADTAAATLHELTVAKSFPDGPLRRLGEVVRFQTGYAFKSEWFTQTGVRLVRNANVSHGRLNWADTVRLPESRYGEFERFRLNAGEIVVSLDRPVISTGVKVARVSSEDLPALLLQRVARACFVGDSVLPDYLFAWLQSQQFKAAIDPGRSNGVPHISHRDIEEISIAVPTLDEQRSAVRKILSIDHSIRTLRATSSEAERELAAMLPAVLDRAFRGAL